MIPKEVKIGYCLKKVKQYIPTLLRCFNVKNMDTTSRTVEDIWHMEGLVKKIQITKGESYQQ